MIARQVALVPESDGVSVPLADIVRIAAIQKQVARDFGSVWQVTATVAGFGALEDVPLGYWPVLLVEDVPKAKGVHLDVLGNPYALVEVGSSWSLTASHEILEMLVDPFGNRLVAGPSPIEDQGRVEFLVEVCDPSEAANFAYTVNNILVADFYTQRYFDPVRVDGVQYSFTGAINEPRQVLPGGYLSWHNPVDDQWFQRVFFGADPEIRHLGVLDRAGGSLREAIDSRTPETKRLSRLDPEAEPLRSVNRAAAEARVASAAKAELLRAAIRRLPDDQ